MGCLGYRGGTPDHGRQPSACCRFASSAQRDLFRHSFFRVCSLIQKTEALRLLLEAFAACPGFAEYWEDQRWRWDDGEAEPGATYPVMSVLARFVLLQVGKSDVVCLARVFEVVEQLVVGGDEPTMLLVTMGMLEDVQTIAGSQLPSPNDLLPLLGPSSLAAWGIISEFWRGKGNLVDVLAREHATGVGMGDILIHRLRPDLG